MTEHELNSLTEFQRRFERSVDKASAARNMCPVTYMQPDEVDGVPLELMTELKEYYGVLCNASSMGNRLNIELISAAHPEWKSAGAQGT